MKFTIKASLALISTLATFIFIQWSHASTKEYEALSAIERQIVHVKVNKDGSYEEVEELTVLIRSQQAIDARSKASIPFSSDKEKVDILEAYTILPDGKKQMVEPTAIRTVDDDVNADSFSDQKYKVIIFPNVKVGSRVYYKQKTTVHTPTYPNHFYYTHHFSPSAEYQKVEFTFSYPKDMPVQVKHRQVAGGKLLGDHGDRYVYRFSFRQTDIKIKEPAQVANIDFAPAIYLSTFKDYIEYGKAYEARAKDKSLVTPGVQALADQITKNILDKKDQARAIYNWVSKEIRYVAIYMGDGGVVPNTADDIIRNRYGDCKDKDTLLIALLKAKGIQAHTVIINSGSAYQLPPIPVFSPFNHVITYIPQWDLYLDATQELAPFGVLGDHITDKPVIITGINKLARTPNLTPENNRIITNTSIKIMPNGEIHGVSNTQYKGNRELAARYRYEGYIATRAEKMVEDHLFRFRQTGTGEFKPSDVYNLNEPFKLETNFHLDPIANFPGPGAIPVPVGLSPGSITLASFNKPKDKLHFPYECYSGYTEENTLIEFPEKTKIVHIPKAMNYKDKNMEYSSTYTKVSETKLRVQRTLKQQRKSMVCQPELVEGWKRINKVLQQDLRSQIIYE